MNFTAGKNLALAVLVSGHNERVALNPRPFLITIVPVGQIHLPTIRVGIPLELIVGIVFVSAIQLKIHFGLADGTGIFVSSVV